MFNLKSRSISIKGSEIIDKPNEDFFIADDDNRIYILADGVTSTLINNEKYPNPSGGELASHIFCEEVYNYLISKKKELAIKPFDVMKMSLSVANHKICSLNQAFNRYKEANFIEKDYFGTVGTVAVNIKDKFFILHVGDAIILLKRKVILKWITGVQTKNVSEYIMKIKDSGVISSRKLMIAVRKDFRNRINSRGLNGEKVSYGVFTGEDGVQDFIQEYEVSIQNKDVILILSDGLSPLINDALSDYKKTKQFCELLDDESEFFDWIIEENDHIAKRSDDKTVITIDVFGMKDAL